MAPNTLYTAKIQGNVKDSAGNQMGSVKTWTFTTSSGSDANPPTVSSTNPAANVTGVALNRKIVANFSEAMDPTTIGTGTFKVQGPSGQVSGDVTLMSNVASFQPTVNLSPTTVYTATLTMGAKDLSGTSMAAPYTWSFKTGSTTDSTAPTVTAVDPLESSTGNSINKKVTVTFSEAMDATTIDSNSFTLKRPNGSLVPSSISYSDKVAILSPNAALTPTTTYTASVSTVVTDTAGNAMATAKTWTFTTSAGLDNVPPTVVSTNPSNNATNVFLNKSINATFSEVMQAASINSSSFTIDGVVGSVSYDTATNIATFRPLADLAINTTYTAHLSTAVQDASGNAMVLRKNWSFTTGNQRAQGTISLGAASTYAVLAGSTVTNGGPTVINGDLGVSPGTAVVGFPPGIVNGAIHAGDAVAAQAKVDLLAAQLDAASRLGAVTLPGDLSGLTLTPGLYKNSTSVMLSAGNVTFDAQGDSDAVFILQMGSTLTTSSGTQVVLAGGAKAINIYWSVGTSATLGVNSIFKGVILAEASITVNTGAVHDGTLLTKTGAVTLQSNTVTRSSKIRK